MEGDENTESPSFSPSSKEFIAIATIGRPSGLQGGCRLFNYGKTLESIALPYELGVGLKKPTKQVILGELIQQKRGFKAFFQGYLSREEIETLKNHNLFIARNELPAKDREEYYHFELEGLKVLCDNTGDFCGKVIAVYNYPTTDALEIQKQDGTSFLIPFNQETVKNIRMKEQNIVVSFTAIKDLM